MSLCLDGGLECPIYKILQFCPLVLIAEVSEVQQYIFRRHTLCTPENPKCLEGEER